MKIPRNPRIPRTNKQWREFLLRTKLASRKDLVDSLARRSKRKKTGDEEDEL